MASLAFSASFFTVLPLPRLAVGAGVAVSFGGGLLRSSTGILLDGLQVCDEALESNIEALGNASMESGGLGLRMNLITA